MMISFRVLFPAPSYCSCSNFKQFQGEKIREVKSKTVSFDLSSSENMQLVKISISTNLDVRKFVMSKTDALLFFQFASAISCDDIDLYVVFGMK